MKVSIITVCFNSAETIEETIRSVMSQDYRDIEYIIVDGGSSDGTLDILKKYSKKIHKLISEPDSGIYDAMNKGIGLATGEILGFLNSGDVYLSQTIIEQIVKSIKAQNADCCYGDLQYVAKNDLQKILRRWKSQPYSDGLFEKGWHPPHPTFYAKKYVFDEYGCFDLNYKISADYELMLRFLKKHGLKSCHIPEVLIKMRSGGKSNRNLWQILKANIECYQAWKKNGLKVSPLIMLRKPFSKLTQCRVKGFLS